MSAMLNWQGAQAKLRIAQALHSGLAELAENTARQARELAPAESGELRKSIQAESHGESAEITADSDHAAAVELGCERTPAHPFLRPAAARANPALVFGGRL